MKDRYKYGIGFWIGAGVLSLINMILNLNHAVQNRVLTYDYLMAGVAIAGLILNLFLLKRAGKRPI